MNYKEVPMTTPENHDAPSGLPAPASPPKPGDSYVQSFARGLEVIRSFSASAPQQTLSEVAAHTGLTRAGARRTRTTLSSGGRPPSCGPRELYAARRRSGGGWSRSASVSPAPSLKR